MDGNEMWENGEWSMTWQVKGGDPEQHKGYHASIAVRLAASRERYANGRKTRLPVCGSGSEKRSGRYYDRS
jgi:hypothetical protein